MTAMPASFIFDTQLVTTTQDWQQFESLLRTYATTDLDQPHLSSIWKDLEDLLNELVQGTQDTWLIGLQST